MKLTSEVGKRNFIKLESRARGGAYAGRGRPGRLPAGWGPRARGRARGAGPGVPGRGPGARGAAGSADGGPGARGRSWARGCGRRAGGAGPGRNPGWRSAGSQLGARGWSGGSGQGAGCAGWGSGLRTESRGRGARRRWGRTSSRAHGPGEPHSGGFLPRARREGTSSPRRDR